MSFTLLRFSLVAILCCATLHSGGRAARAQDAPPRPQQEGIDILDAAAVGAENKCERGAELSKNGDARGAVEALGEAVELYRQVYLKGRAPAPPADSASLTTFRSKMSYRLARAPDCIELYARLGGRKGASDFERSQLETLRAHALGLIEPDASRAVFFSRETDTRAVISYKSEPRFPRGARGPRGTPINVTVQVRVVLGADGKVRDALVTSGPPALFGEMSVEATKTIKFKPAEKGGRPVSQFVTLEYGFQSY